MKAALSSNADIHVFTRGVHTVTSAKLSHEPASAQGAVLGYCRAFSREILPRKIFNTDLCPSGQCDDNILANQALTRLLRGGDDEEEISVRANIQYVSRLESNKELVAQVRSTPPLQCVLGAAYIVTGGMGGLGLQLAKYLLTECACDRLILLGRSANRSSPKLVPIIAIAEEYGANVEVMQCGPGFILFLVTLTLFGGHAM